MDPRDAARQLDLVLRSEALAKVAREQLGLNIDPGTVARVAGGGAFAEKEGIFSRLKTATQYLVSGVTGQTWMGPFQPLRPLTTDPEQGTIGRQLDYPVGYNTQIQPRSNEAISFATLRGLAEGYDLLRLAVETCKDQIESFEWEIIPEEKDADAAQFKDEIRRVSDFLARPDREHNWNQWLRMVLEDMLVLDAVAIFPQKTRGGDLYSFDLIDASTIKRVIDEYGRTPMPPNPAYQQVLKGIPAVDYNRDDLAYLVRNPRTWKLYGYSPVEQVIMTVNIALRRQVSQLQYYTEGNVPESLVSAPDTWTAEQVKDFQMWWDSKLAGNTGQRRRMHFVPNLKDGKVVLTKGADQLKDEYDEWLAKIICYAFSIAPSALIKQMNRASSEQIAVSAKEEGQLPRMRFIATQINFLLKTYLKVQGVKFSWKTDRAVDPLQKAQTTKIYVEAKVITPDEARAADLGLAPLTAQQKETAWPAPVMVDPAGSTALDAEGKPVGPKSAQGEAPPDPKKKDDAVPPGGAAKEPMGKSLQGAVLGLRKAKAAPVVTAVAKAVAKRERSLMLSIRAQMKHHGAAIASAAAKAYSAAGYPRALNKKAWYMLSDPPQSLRKDDAEDFVLRILNELQVEDMSVDIVGALSAEVRQMFKQAGINGVAQVGVAASREITQHLDEAAKNYAKTRSATLVKGLSDTTRERLRTTLEDGVERGLSTEELRANIEDGAAFDESRARVIARTELANAHVQGNVEGWRETGEVEGKRSILGDLHDVPDECDDCVDAGTVDMDADFVEGLDFPPYHPNCVCDVLPVLRSTETEEEE